MIYEEESAASLYLNCPLKNSTMIGLGNIPGNPMISSYFFPKDSIPTAISERFYLDIPISFDGPKRERLPTLEETIDALQKENLIECTMVMAHMPPLPTYRSKPFYLRAEDLLQALGK